MRLLQLDAMWAMRAISSLVGCSMVLQMVRYTVYY